MQVQNKENKVVQIYKHCLESESKSVSELESDTESKPKSELESDSEEL